MGYLPTFQSLSAVGPEQGLALALPLSNQHVQNLTSALPVGPGATIQTRPCIFLPRIAPVSLTKPQRIRIIAIIGLESATTRARGDNPILRPVESLLHAPPANRL